MWDYPDFPMDFYLKTQRELKNNKNEDKEKNKTLSVLEAVLIPTIVTFPRLKIRKIKDKGNKMQK